MVLLNHCISCIIFCLVVLSIVEKDMLKFLTIVVNLSIFFQFYQFLLYIFFKDFIYLYLEKGKGGRRREREKHQSVASIRLEPDAQPRHVT